MMGKDKSEKKVKKEKKEKRSESDGVKKEKKEKHSRKDLTAALENQLEAEKPGSGLESVAATNGVISKVEDDGEAMEADTKVRIAVPKSALVPFANPLADEKQTKKVLRSVKKAAKNKTLKRGVKEVVKSLRKTPSSGPGSAAPSSPVAIVVIAADISPMDVISHLPVLCEETNIPYIYVTSRAELGAAGSTKRPTSVVMITKERAVRKNKEGTESKAEEPMEDWPEIYAELVKVVEKASKSVKI